MNPSCQKGIVQASADSVMVWDVFPRHVLRHLVKPIQSFTGKDYNELPSVFLQLFKNFMYPNNGKIFENNHAECHQSSIIRD
ncbi:hypothetical protein TNCV_3985911 [Trichonephila clavipes]|nr:hypothetical protein TNCV_3985911 [Trichonephila clavipes]